MDAGGTNAGHFILLGMWVLPALLVLLARQVRGRARWLSFVGVLVTSWLGWVIFSLVAARWFYRSK